LEKKELNGARKRGGKNCPHPPLDGRSNGEEGGIEEGPARGRERRPSGVEFMGEWGTAQLSFGKLVGKRTPRRAGSQKKTKQS